MTGSRDIEKLIGMQMSLLIAAVPMIWGESKKHDMFVKRSRSILSAYTLSPLPSVVREHYNIGSDKQIYPSKEPGYEWGSSSLYTLQGPLKFTGFLYCNVKDD